MNEPVISSDSSYPSNLNEQVKLLTDLVWETPLSVGIINRISSSNNPVKYCVLNASKAFYQLVGQVAENKNLTVDEAFGCFDAFNSNIFVDLFNQTHSEFVEVYLVKENKRYKLRLKPVNLGQIIFYIDRVDESYIQIEELADKHDNLHKSEELFRAIFTDAPMAIAIVNRQLKPNLVNPHFCRLLGYSADELQTLSINDFTHADDIEKGREQYQLLFDNQIDYFSFTKRYITRDGQIIWVSITVSALKDYNGQNSSAIAMVHDVTAERQANAGLVKSEQNYRTLIESATDGIGLFDYNFKPVIYNTALYRMLGYTIEEYLKFDHLKFELFHPSDKASAQIAIENVLNGKKSVIEKRLRNVQGGYQWFSISYIPVLHDNKPGILIFRRDISKRVEAEVEKEEYRLFLETIMDNMPVSLFAKTTPDFKYLYWNCTMEQNTGISAEQAIGATDFELPFFRKYAQQYHNEDLKLLQNKRRLDCEHEYTNNYGEKMQFRTIKTLHQSSTGNPIILGLSMDITRMKEAELKVDQSNQMLKEAQKIANLGFWEYDIEKDLFFDNPENREILGIQHLSYFINARQFIDLAMPSDQKEIEQAFINARETKMPGTGIIRFMVNNEIKHVIVNYKPVTDADQKVVKLRGTTLDITRIRQAEIALRESETKLKQAEQIAKLGYWTYNYSNKTTQFSDEVWRILEQEPNSEQINLNDFFNAVHPKDKGEVFSAFLSAREASQSFNYDFRIITKRNNTKFIKAKGTFIKNTKGEISKSLGTFQDITELKNAELQLKNYTDRLNAIQSISKTGYFEHNPTKEETFFSDTFLAIVGRVNSNGFSLKEYYNHIHPDDAVTIDKTYSKSRTAKEGYNVQYRLRLPNGQIKYLNEICRYQSDESLQNGTFIHIIQDITDLKEINFALEESTVQLQTAHLSASIGNWEYNINHDEYIISTELKKLLDFEPISAKLKFKEIIKLIHPDDRNSVKKVLMHSFRNLTNYQLTYRVLNQATGETMFVKDSGSIVLNPQGEYVCHATLSNITEVREVKQELFEVSELFRTIAENSLFGALILQNKRHVFANSRWCNLLGLPKQRIIDKATIEQLFQPECAAFISDLFEKWEQFRLHEYTNKISLSPRNAPAFEAEVFVKEIVFQSAQAFLIMACPIKN